MELSFNMLWDARGGGAHRPRYAHARDPAAAAQDHRLHRRLPCAPACRAMPMRGRGLNRQGRRYASVSCRGLAGPAPAPFRAGHGGSFLMALPAMAEAAARAPLSAQARPSGSRCRWCCPTRPSRFWVWSTPPWWASWATPPRSARWASGAVILTSIYWGLRLSAHGHRRPCRPGDRRGRPGRGWRRF